MLPGMERCGYASQPLANRTDADPTDVARLGLYDALGAASIKSIEMQSRETRFFVHLPPINYYIYNYYLLCFCALAGAGAGPAAGCTCIYYF